MMRSLTLSWFEVKLAEQQEENYLEVTWVEKGRHMGSERDGKEMEKGQTRSVKHVFGAAQGWCWAALCFITPGQLIKPVVLTHTRQVKPASTARTGERKCFSWLTREHPT